MAPPFADDVCLPKRQLPDKQLFRFFRCRLGVIDLSQLLQDRQPPPSAAMHKSDWATSRIRTAAMDLGLSRHFDILTSQKKISANRIAERDAFRTKNGNTIPTKSPEITNQRNSKDPDHRRPYDPRYHVAMLRRHRWPEDRRQRYKAI